VNVTFTAYPSESDQVGYPIPEEAKVNPLFTESQGSDKGDRICAFSIATTGILRARAGALTGQEWEANRRGV
jgi:hypothetical protein